MKPWKAKCKNCGRTIKYKGRGWERHGTRWCFMGGRYKGTTHEFERHEPKVIPEDRTDKDMPKAIHSYAFGTPLIYASPSRVPQQEVVIRVECCNCNHPLAQVYK